MLLLLLALACNGDDDGTGPPPGTDSADSGLTEPTWADCETSSLRYDTFAQPLLATWCTPCHASDLVEEERSGAPVGLDFDSYDSVFALGAVIASSIEEERMPPVGGLSLEEREAFVAWVECGMPEGEAVDPEPGMCEAPTDVAPGDVDCADPAQALGVAVAGDLSPSADLSCVCTVLGDLTPSGSVVLDHLEVVEGDVTLTTGTVELPDLREVGSLSITGPGLERVLLDALELVHGDVSITDTTLTRFDLPRLDVVEGSLLAAGNRQLTQGLRFANVTVLEGDARFIDNDALVAQVLFGHLERFDGDIEVRSHDAMVSLVGLGGLEDLGGRLQIDENPVLELINLGIHLESIGGGLSVLGNPELTLVETFPALTSIGMDGTPDPADPGAVSLYLVANSSLESVASFPALQEVGGMYIGGALRLASVGPFPSLTTLPGDLIVENTRQLTEPPDLGAVSTIGGDLHIDGNRALRTLLPIVSLGTVGGDLQITGNTDLPTADAQAFADSLTVGGTTTVAGNQ